MASLETDWKTGGRGGGNEIDKGLDSDGGVEVFAKVDGDEVGGRVIGGGGRNW